MTNAIISVHGQKLIQVDKNTYEGFLDDVDFVITKENDEFYVDIFDALLNDSNEAHLDSMEQYTMVKKYWLNYFNLLV